MHSYHQSYAKHGDTIAAGKAMNKKIMVAVEQAFIERFGPWAGWAHNTLFISELASQRDRLPVHLQPGVKAKAPPAPKAPQLDPAGIDDQAAHKLGSRAAADSTVADDAAVKKRKLSGRSPKAETSKIRAKSALAEGSINEENGTAATDLIPQGSDLGQLEEKVPQRASRAKRKSKASRSTAAQPDKRNQNETSSSIDVAAAAAVDQAMEDGATQSLAKRKRRLRTSGMAGA